MRSPIFVLLLVTGCDQVFDLDRPDLVIDARICEQPTGHDEDLDEVDDACDLCPAHPDPDQADRDGDRVGDPCDPKPDAAGDMHRRFYSFAEANSAAHWTGESRWTFEPDRLALDGLAIEQTSPLELVEVPTPVPFEIQLQVTFDGVDRAQAAAFGVLPNIASGEEFLQCALDHPATSPDQIYAFGKTPTNQTTRFDNAPLDADAYRTGASFPIRIRVTRNTMSCRTGQTGEIMVEIQIPVTAPVSGKIALEVRRTRLHIDWFSLITTTE